MNDLATLTGRPGRLVAGDEAHDAHPLSIEDWGELQAWVDRQFPDPLDVVDRLIARRDEEGRPLPMAQQQFLLRAALEEASRPKKLLGSAEADDTLRTADGFAEILFLAIRRGEPDFTRADARRFYGRLSAVQLHKLMIAAHADLVLSDPKATTPAPSGPAASPTAAGPGSTGGTSSTAP